MNMEPAKEHLRATVAFMRELGIVHYKDSYIEITLGPKPEPDEIETPEALNKPANSGKVGKDGLTAAGQRARYGFVMDAQE